MDEATIIAHGARLRRLLSYLRHPFPEDGEQDVWLYMLTHALAPEWEEIKRAARNVTIQAIDMYQRRKIDISLYSLDMEYNEESPLSDRIAAPETIEGELIVMRLLDGKPVDDLIDARRTVDACLDCYGPIQEDSAGVRHHNCKGHWHVSITTVPLADETARASRFFTKNVRACAVPACGIPVPRGRMYCPKHGQQVSQMNMAMSHGYEHTKHPCAWCGIRQARATRPFCGKECSQEAMQYLLPKIKLRSKEVTSHAG